jgi:hypothetical protein
LIEVLVDNAYHPIALIDENGAMAPGCGYTKAAPEEDLAGTDEQTAANKAAYCKNRREML